jgi:DNA-directed RNA polymerase specialized sigma24 family protein
MGQMAEDFVQTAIKEAMSGERQFDPTRSLFKNLCQIISSEVSNAVQSYENKNVKPETDDNIVLFPDPRESPEASAVYKQIAERFLAYVETRDPPAKQVAEQIIYSGRGRSLELSVELRLPVSDIENIKKRLRRLCADFQQVHEGVPALQSATKKPSVGGS